MDLDSSKSAILAAVIFNALVIVALIPLALRGVRFRAASAAEVLRRNLLVYGVGGLVAPFVGIKAIDLLLVATGGRVMAPPAAARPPGDPGPHPRRSASATRSSSPQSARRRSGTGPTGRWSRSTGAVVGSELLGQAFTEPRTSTPARRRPATATTAPASSGSNLGPTNPELLAAVEERVAAYRELNGLDDAVPGAGRRRHRLRLGPRPARVGRQRPAAGSSHRPRAGGRRRAWCSTSSTTTPRGARSASSATTPSTSCSSTSPSTRSRSRTDP